MDLYPLFISLLLSLLLPFPSLLSSQSPLPPPQLWCHDDERSALLEFKGSFRSDSSCFDSWKLEEKAQNCCSWHGVTCGGPFSHVIGLHLSDCGLYGSINSNTSISRLQRVTQLFPSYIHSIDFSHNNFQGSLPSSYFPYRREIWLPRAFLLKFTYAFHFGCPPWRSLLWRLDDSH